MMRYRKVAVMVIGLAGLPGGCGHSLPPAHLPSPEMAPPRAVTVKWRIPAAVAGQLAEQYRGDWAAYWRARKVMPDAWRLEPQNQILAVTAQPGVQREIQRIWYPAVQDEK